MSTKRHWADEMSRDMDEHPEWFGLVIDEMGNPVSPPDKSVQDSWKDFKSGKSWSQYNPICRDETTDVHTKHMMFTQGWFAALQKANK